MAVRFPKNVYVDAHRAVQGGTNSSVGPVTNPRTFQDNVSALVAPSRYSNVRKVIISMVTGKYGAVDGTFADCRLGINTWTASAPTLTLEAFNLPNSSIIENTPQFGMRGTGIFEFNKLGPVTRIENAPVGVAGDNHDRAQIIQMEFDRFSADSVDFFAAWDSIANDDVYMLLRPRLLVTATDAASLTSFAMRFHNLQVTVVQAPGNPNNSNTDWAVNTGLFDENETGVVFKGPVRSGVHVFRYIAADWDGITNVSYVQFGAQSGGATVTFRVFDHTANAVLFDEVHTFTAAGFYVARSQNFLSQLIDGHVYSVDDRLDAAPAATPPSASGFISVVQKAFTKTVTIHNITNLLAIPVGVDESDISSFLFNPLWYEDFTDERILKRRLFSTITNTSATDFAPDQNLRIDTNLLSDDSARGSPTAVNVVPAHTPVENGFLPPSVHFLFTAIISGDPIDLAGQRKLTQSYPLGGAWGDDIPGGMGLYYALDVPATDVPELGPLFSLDAFSPEGCAATAAGLGDPGILVITNGSSIPQKFDPIANLIEDNGVPEPLCNEVPTAVPDDTAISPTGGLGIGIYFYRYTFRNCCTGKEGNPNDTDIVVDTTGQSPAAEVEFGFGGVRIPGDSQICEICLYRSVLHQPGDVSSFPVMAKVGCFNPDETSSFIDRVSDSALDFTNDGLSTLNAPMPCVPVVVDYRNRLFGMGDIPQLSPAGTVSVVQGSTVVTGSANVVWDRCLEGKYIQVQGDCRVYEIDRVCPPEEGLSPPFNRLFLVDEYEGNNDTGLLYTICGRPNRLYFSEPLEPECWPEINFLDIEPGDGDRLMGAVSNFNRLIICKRRKTYVLTFNANPLTEVVVPSRVSSDIGCIGPRTFAQTESGSVWLSDRGLAIYDGRSVAHIPESAEMNDMFIDPDNPRYVRRDRNGRVIDAVGVFYPKAEQYLCILPTVRTTRGCDVMLVWDVKLRNITILEFCQQFQSMVVGKDSDGNERVYLGDTDGFVWIYDLGDNDGAGFPNATGTLRGTITAAGVDEATGASFLDDAAASFIEGGLPGLAGLSGTVGLSGAVTGDELGLAGVCLYTRPADSPPGAAWVQRVIFASTQTRLFVTPGWVDDTPSVGDEYMIGPIDFRAIFKIKNYGQDEDLKRTWSQVLVHEPESIATQLRLELRPDFQNSDPDDDFLLDVDGNPTVQRLVDLSFSRGRQTFPVGRTILNFEQVVLSNFAPEEPARILNHIIRLTPRIGG